MKKFLPTLLCAALVSAAIAQEPAEEEPQQQNIDHIYLKDTQSGQGYKKIAGELESVSRNHVLFVRQGANDTYLYTRKDVERVDLGEDDEKEFGAVVEEHWKDKKIPTIKSGDGWEFAIEFAINYLPGVVVTGFLVLVIVYFLASTLLQAYQRFVLEGNLKRLNTEKLLGEIDKLRIEVFEMRQRLGLSLPEETLPLTEAEDRRVDQPESPLPVDSQLEKRVSLPEIRLPEFHFVDFVKTRILHIRAADDFDARKQQLAEYWQDENQKNPGWFKLKYFSYNTIMAMAIWTGWIFALLFVGNIVGYFADPSYREIFGAGVTSLFAAILIVLVVAVIRLGQKRKLRRSAYRQVFDIKEIDA